MVWSLRPEMAGMVDRMIKTAYERSKLPAAEREVARMRARASMAGAARVSGAGAARAARAARLSVVSNSPPGT